MGRAKLSFQAIPWPATSGLDAESDSELSQLNLHYQECAKGSQPEVVRMVLIYASALQDFMASVLLWLLNREVSCS